MSAKAMFLEKWDAADLVDHGPNVTREDQLESLLKLVEELHEKAAQLAVPLRCHQSRHLAIESRTFQSWVRFPSPAPDSKGFDCLYYWKVLKTLPKTTVLFQGCSKRWRDVPRLPHKSYALTCER